MPYPDFHASAVALDPRRLGKQRVEALQVLRALVRPEYGWKRHPAVRMWTGYEEALVRYGLEVCAVWCAADRPDTCATSIAAEYAGPVRTQSELAVASELPPWLGREDLHLSHRSALVRKDPAWYRPLFGDISDDLPYVWPASDRA
nr:MSMEG_6728 family protein [Planosporangium thailandense]